MADICFFTDLNRLDNQTSDDAFGPVSTNPNNLFNVGSIHRYTGGATYGPNVYAVISGSVVIRPVPGSIPQLVTMILKPSEQPGENLPKIKFIVYRGVLASSLIYNNGGAESILLDTDPNANDLTKKMQKSHIDRGGAAPVSSVAIQAVVQPVTLPSGILETNQQAKLFRSFNAGTVFTAPLDGPNQPPEVKAGEYIGRFDPNNFGIEIIQDNVGFEPDIAYAELSNKLVLATSESKENILPFLDPCAFYGSFDEQKILVYSNSGLSSDNGAPSGLIKPKGQSNVYDQLLQTAFFNRNKVYIEIRNQYNYSYDFFGEYSGLDIGNPNNNLKFSTNATALQTAFTGIDYDNFNGISWPLMIVTTTDFSPSSNSSGKSTIRLSFPQGGQFDPLENKNPVLYVAQGDIKTKFLKKSKQCNLPEFGGPLNNLNFTRPINFEIENSSNNLGPISSYIRIKYSKQPSQCPAPNSSGPVIRSVELLDNLFRPFDMTVKAPASITNFQLRVYEEEIHVDALGFTGQSHFSHQGIARDVAGNVTFFVFAQKYIINNQGDVHQPMPITDNTTQSAGGFPDFIVQNILNPGSGEFCLSAEDIVINPPTPPPFPIINNIQQIGLVGTTNDYARYNPNDLLWITFTQADFAVITAAMQGAGFDNQWRGIHLGLIFNRGVISGSNGLEYAEYRVVLRGPIGGTITTIETGILHYRSAGIRNMNPQLIGRGYTVSSAGTTTTFLEPNGQNAHILSPTPGYSQNPGDPTPTVLEVPVHNINSTIYLQRGWNIGNAEFCQFKSYFENNIKTVWDSNTNWGLGSTYLDINVMPSGSPSPPGAGLSFGDFVRSHIIQSNNIKVEVASAKQFQMLKKGECMFMVTRATGNALPAQSFARSYVDGNRKTGEMFYSPIQPSGFPNVPGTPYVDNENIPAHEFGHVLGLADYYGYIAEGHRNTSSSNDHLVNPNNGGAIGLYNIDREGNNFDPEFGVRYNWMHNLMSKLENVPDFTNSLGSAILGLMQGTATYQRYMQWYTPTLPDTSTNSRITVFVTPTQLNHIISNTPQNEIKNYVCFRDWNGNSASSVLIPGYLGTFVAPTKIPGTNQEAILTDEQFRSDFNVTTYDVLFNKFQHNMFYRAMTNAVNVEENGVTPIFNDVYQSYFNPFYPNPDQNSNSLDNRNVLIQDNIVEPTQFNKLHFVYPEGNIDFLYDIEIGGNALNNDNGMMKVCQNQISTPAGVVRSLIPTAPANLPVPSPDDIVTGWTYSNKEGLVGINARRIFANALWWVNEHIQQLINQNLNLDGTDSSGTQIIPGFTPYEILLTRFFTTTGLALPEVKSNLSLLISTRNFDKFSNVGEGNKTLVFPGRLYWNYKLLNTDKHRIPGGPFANGGGLLDDGNGHYPLKFVELGGNKRCGYKLGYGDQPNFRLDYDIYKNRRTIIRLIRNSFLP